MIRRDPTLIPMTDNDVQDVRDAVKERFLMRVFAQEAGLDPDAVPGFAVQEEAQRKKAEMSKNERLGIQ